ncbi:hypothetical protein BCR32DRAFT_251268 [Anaeromyces robustus]|uniref:Uncharacterized protein n=1 Tax=Anaeromyces robustus TaxID=1754192 RepID=A0A1Y1VS71_9FUNG|nr:hypothetical protein BCR32DRAFT_251268 [Anaeromyces robustus]|eukprot:ORX64140.1 hypothetical protein BCR32DRAFT_251268 [Anaeromyces robustus]
MNNLEYYKHKKNSIVIKYLKEYNLYNEGNFKSEEIKLLICLIIKDLSLPKLKKQEILESVLKELFENYRYDRDYEVNNFFKYNSNFILKLLLYYKNKIKFSKKEFELLLIKEKEDKCNSVINFNVIDRYDYYEKNSTDKYNVRRIVNPLFIASYHNCKDIINMLVNKYGAYIYIKDNENNTLLHIGAKSGNLTTPLLLFSKEYNIDIKNNKGETPLHKACIQYRYKKEGTIDRLLKRGANINAQDNEVDCSPYNHLDLQIALLILSAGDHKGNIVKDLDEKPLKINISIKNFDNNKYIKDITEIIPKLNEVKTDSNYDTDSKKTKEIERRFKELYKLAEIIVCDRLGYEYIEHLNDPYVSELYNRYKDNPSGMETEFENHMENIDIFRKLTGIQLIDSDKELSIMSIYDRKVENPDRNGVTGNSNNILKIYKNGSTLMDENSEIYTLYKDVGESCINTKECYELFYDKDAIYKSIKENTDFTLIKENNGNENILHFIVKDNDDGNIYAFKLKYDNENSKYMFDTSKIKSLTLTDVNDSIKGYGKKSSNTFNEEFENTGYVEGKGIHIISESGVKLEYRVNGEYLYIKSYNPEDYIYKDNNNKGIENMLSNVILNLRVQPCPNYDDNKNLLCSYKSNLNTVYQNIVKFLNDKVKNLKELRDNTSGSEHEKYKKEYNYLKDEPKKLKNIKFDNEFTNNYNTIKKIYNNFLNNQLKGDYEKYKESEESNILKSNKEKVEIINLINDKIKENENEEYLNDLNKEVDEYYKSKDLNSIKEEYKLNDNNENNEVLIKNIIRVTLYEKEEENKIKFKNIKEDVVNEYIKTKYLNLESTKNKINNIKIDEFLKNQLKYDYEKYKKSEESNILESNEKTVEIINLINDNIIKDENEEYLNDLNKEVDKSYKPKYINKIIEMYKLNDNNKNNEVLIKNIIRSTKNKINNIKFDELLNDYLKYIEEEIKNGETKKSELEEEYTTEKKIIRDSSKQNLIEKLQPVSKNMSGDPNYYSFINILNDISHNSDLEPSIELVNEANKLTIEDFNGKYKQYKIVSKRSLGSCKMCNQIKMIKEITISSKTIETLKTFKDMNLNPNILPFSSDVNDINNPNMLVKDANSIDEVWNTLVETYKNNIDKFDKEKSEKFIRDFNSIINDHILEYTDSNYSNNDNKMDEEKINKLISLRSEIISIHENKYEPIEDIELRSLNSHDSQSRYNKNRLKRLISKLSKIAGINPNTILNSENPLSAINELCEELDKVENIEDINSIYNELNDLKSNNELELINKDESSMNSEIVHELYNSVASKNGMEMDNEVVKSENNLKVLNDDNTNEGNSSDKSIDENTLKTLKALKDKNIDKNILPSQYEVDDISNPKLLYKNAESLVNVWKKLSTSYNKNFDKFSEKESADFIVGFNNVINELKSMLSNSKYNNDLNMKKINGEDIKTLEKYFNRDYNLHKEKFKIIRDNKGDEMIYHLKYNKDLNSKYYKKNIINNLNKLLSIVNLNRGNLIYGLGTRFEDGKISSEIDYRTIGEGNNLNEALDNLCELTETLDVSSLSDDHKNELRKLYENFHDMILRVNKEYDHGKIISGNSNSHVIYKLHNSLAMLLDEDTFDINDDINDSEIKLTDPDLEPLEESKELIFKGVESQIKNSKNKYLNKNTYNFITETKKHIDQQGIKIKELKSYKGNELHLLNFVSLSSNYNDLVGTAICYDRVLSSDINNDIPISTLEFDRELDNRVNYVITNELNSVVSDTIKNHPKIYNIKNQFCKEGSFTWGSNTVSVISESSLINMFFDHSNINSKSDVLSHLIEDSTIESHDTLGYSVELSFQYMNYQSPGSINQKDANAISRNYNKLHNKLVKNIQPIDEFQNQAFSEAIDEVKQYNPNIESKISEDVNVNVEEVFNEMSEYDDKIKDSMTKDIKTHVENSVRKFNIYIGGSYYKFSKMLGRENQVTINDYKKYFNDVVKYVSNYIIKNNINLNDKGLVINIKPNMNNIDNIHNHSYAKNNIGYKFNIMFIIFIK